MPLTVEDGTGLANSDALVSLADFKTIMDARGEDYSAYTDAALENAIRRGTQHISRSFRYRGTPVNGRSQALPFPMSGLTDAYGNEVASDAVPGEIEEATAHAALLEAASPNAFAPTQVPSSTAGTGIKRIREKLDVLETETEYTDAAANGGLNVSALQAAESKVIEDLLKPFIWSSGSGVRAVARA